jgi:hypothetical protein
VCVCVRGYKSMAKHQVAPIPLATDPPTNPSNTYRTLADCYPQSTGLDGYPAALINYLPGQHWVYVASARCCWLLRINFRNTSSFVAGASIGIGREGVRFFPECAKLSDRHATFSVRVSRQRMPQAPPSDSHPSPKPNPSCVASGITRCREQLH